MSSIRSGSPDRKKLKQPAVSGKWDEGFGGVYLPTGGADSGVIASINPAASLPTVGAVQLRKLTVNNIKKEKSAQDVVDWLAGEILERTGYIGEFSKIAFPVVGCQFLTQVGATRNALVEFRTPEAASVCLTILEEEGMRAATGVKAKRPRDFPQDVSPAGIAKEKFRELSIEQVAGKLLDTPGTLQDGSVSGAASTTTLATVGGAQPSPESINLSARLSVYGLPGNSLPEQIVRDLFCQFGKIKSITFPKDPISGLVRPGVTGYIEYEELRDAATAEQILNGFPCGNSVVKISRVGAGAGMPGGVAAGAARRAVPASSVSSSVTARILNNPILANQIKQGREIGSRPSLVVQLLNAVYPEDILDDADYNEIVKEVKTEASKFGHIETIKIPRPTAVNAYPAGTGKIFVQFSDLTCARKFQQDMNGRTFDGSRVVCAAFYPVDRFVQGKYVLF